MAMEREKLEVELKQARERIQGIRRTIGRGRSTVGGEWGRNRAI